MQTHWPGCKQCGNLHLDAEVGTGKLHYASVYQAQEVNHTPAVELEYPVSVETASHREGLKFEMHTKLHAVWTGPARKRTGQTAKPPRRNTSLQIPELNHDSKGRSHCSKAYEMFHLKIVPLPAMESSVKVNSHLNTEASEWN